MILELGTFAAGMGNFFLFVGPVPYLVYKQYHDAMMCVFHVIVKLRFCCFRYLFWDSIVDLCMRLTSGGTCIADV